MNERHGRIVRWRYAVGVAIAGVILLFWLEWLGSERPLTMTEVTVSQPAAKQETGLDVEK